MMTASPTCDGSDQNKSSGCKFFKIVEPHQEISPPRDSTGTEPPIGWISAEGAMGDRGNGVGEHFRVRRLVLFLVALCYLAAFASLRAQWIGLFGTHGVTPVDALLAQVQKNGGLSSLYDRIWTLPSLLWFAESSSVDAMGEAICSAGAVLSVTAASLALFTQGGVAPSCGCYCGGCICRCSTSARSS